MNEARDNGRTAPEPALLLVLAGAARSLFFTNLWAAAGWWAGRPLPFSLALGLGLGTALALSLSRSNEPADWRAAGRLSALFLAMALPLYLAQRANVGHDWLCHVPLTGSLLRGNLPARDLASPARWLPYHHGFNIVAAAVLGLLRRVAPAAHTESALDLATWAGLAWLLMAAWLWLRRLNRDLPEPARIGRGETLVALGLLLYGGGLILAGRWMDPGVEPWGQGVYASCPPLLLLAGRRPTPLGQALLLFQLAVLRSPPGPRRVALFLLLLTSNALLLLTAEELYLAGVLMGLLWLAWPAERAAARMCLGAAAAALPLACVQGGLLTALLFNAPLGESLAGWRLRLPFLPGWGLGDPTFLQGRFWAALLVEFPFTLWTIPLAAWAARRRGLALPPAWKTLSACCAVFLLLPTVVQSRYTPHDLHRLFLLPQMFSLLLWPMHLRLLIRSPGPRGLVLAATAALLAAGPVSALRAEIRHFDRLYGRGWTPDLSLPATAERLEDGQVWLVSTRHLRALHYNGFFALSAPFGTYGPNYYKIYPDQHEAWLERYLPDPAAHGATRALLTARDFDRLKAGGAAHTTKEQGREDNGEPFFLLSFPPGGAR